MTNKETAEYLRRYVRGEVGSKMPFAWPLDHDYHQHIKLVCYRNENFTGTTPEDFDKFILEYADKIEDEPDDKLDLWPNPLATPSELIQARIEFLETEKINGVTHNALDEFKKFKALLEKLEIGQRE